MAAANETSPAKTDSSSGRNYAGFWRRLAAAVLDGIIIAVVLVPFSMALGVGRNNGAGDGLYSLISLAISWGYPWYFIGAKGQTPGKMALSVKVIRKSMLSVTPPSLSPGTALIISSVNANIITRSTDAF